VIASDSSKSLFRPLGCRSHRTVRIAAFHYALICITDSPPASPGGLFVPGTLARSLNAVWRTPIQTAVPGSARAVRQPHRRFGRFAASTSSEGLCGLNPSRRSRFALLRIAQRGRCNSSTSSDIECVGHKATSLRSSSSVQRDIVASKMEAPSSSNVAVIRAVTWEFASTGNQPSDCNPWPVLAIESLPD